MTDRHPLALAASKVSLAAFWLLASPSFGQASGARPFWAGNWSLNVGAVVLSAPRFSGSGDQIIRGLPQISIGRSDRAPRFRTRNDGLSIAFVDTGMFRMGAVGRFVGERSNDTPSLRGFRTVPWGAEAGAFVDVFPVEWLRARTELRQGLRAHEGVRADLSVDAFTDFTPRWRLSAGPRLSLASRDYMQTYFGVDASAAAASRLPLYRPEGGMLSAGFGGALTWRTTERVTTSLFGEFSRLLGPAADSDLVQQRGSVDQFRVGVSASYRFDFSL